jgi:hypothetical protein
MQTLNLADILLFRAERDFISRIIAWGTDLQEKINAEHL